MCSGRCGSVVGRQGRSKRGARRSDDARQPISLLAVVTLAAFLATWALLRPVQAEAGIGDAALPQFSDGKASTLVMRVPGVVSRSRLETVFLCTSLASVPVDIGVQVFTRDGTLINDVSADVGAVLDVAPGQTVTLATSATVTYLESALIPSTDVSQGSARVIASSNQVDCNVMLVDDFVTPPVSLATLGEGTVPSDVVLPAGAPLPMFSDGKAATHTAVFSGIIKRLDD